MDRPLFYALGQYKEYNTQLTDPVHLHQHSSINSPQILELSGIGNPRILSDIGVDVKIDLPGVGENLQEHTILMTAFELRPDAPTECFDLFVDPAHRKLAEVT
jgi:choline dehydrogenase-like flavoprotein